MEDDIVGEIRFQQIFLKIPEDIDASRLVASFEHNGKSVHVNSKQQVSGETENDFTQEIKYEIIAENEQGRVYEVLVERQEEENPVEEVVIPQYICRD